MRNFYEYLNIYPINFRVMLFMVKYFEISRNGIDEINLCVE